MIPLKIGIIGFDTSHAPAFAKLLNDPNDLYHVSGAKVVAGIATFSPDLEASASRVQGFTDEMRDQHGVEVLGSIEELIERVDAILLASVDGRRHLAEAAPVIKARRPLFIDKPFAANYHDAVAIARLAQEHDSPLFSSSSLRFDANLTAIKDDLALGGVLACDAFSPAALEPTNPGLFWYGIHGIEILYTFMGVGCEKVLCRHTSDYDVVIGTWPTGRLATMRGLRTGGGDIGATVFGEDQVMQFRYSHDVPAYAQLMRAVVAFFGGAPSPVPLTETLEIMAFMQAALLSADEGREVALEEITEGENHVKSR